MMTDFRQFLNKKVMVVFSTGGEIQGLVISVFEEEIELKLLDSDDVSEIKISDIECIEELLVTRVKKSGNIKTSGSGQDTFVDKNGKKIRKKKPPRGAFWP